VPRFFNTAGPCRADLHFMLDPLRRIADARRYVERQEYFVIHAPRQTGKTTSLEALARALTSEGTHAALLVSCEVGAAFRDDIGAAEDAMLDSFRSRAERALPPELRPPVWDERPAGRRIARALAQWSSACPRPIAIFLDEIDALHEPVLMSVLRQLRDGHGGRPDSFPASIALCGMRDVRDYKVASGGSPSLGTSSPFNVKVESLSIRDFTRDEIAELYALHTGETGQRFDADAVDAAWELTQGQPWLVNALAREATERIRPDRTEPIDRAAIDDARERLILRQDTHLDSLAERLREERVRRVIEPILAGSTLASLGPDDVRYAVDLGLVRRTTGGAFRIANPIYQEVIPRVLSSDTQGSIPVLSPTWIRADGRLDADALLAAFVAFWRQHGEPLMRGAPYHEVAPHLVLLAFLHRVVNGGGRVEREYAIGTGRMDVLVEWGPPERRDRVAMELKVWRDGEPDPRAEGLAQLDTYLGGLGLSTGWLVVFDRRAGLGRLAERVVTESATTPAGRAVVVVRA
jgi:hypothetical protein